MYVKDLEAELIYTDGSVYDLTGESPVELESLPWGGEDNLPQEFLGKDLRISSWAYNPKNPGQYRITCEETVVFRLKVVEPETVIYPLPGEKEEVVTYYYEKVGIYLFPDYVGFLKFDSRVKPVLVNTRSEVREKK